MNTAIERIAFSANVVTISSQGELYSNIQHSGEIMSTMNQVVHQLQARRRQSEKELEKLDLAIKALGSLDGAPLTSQGTVRRKPHFSAAARERIAAAQRARWKKLKAAQKK
jgi:hypothetical protein